MNEYGEYEQVNGTVVNALNDRIAELEAALAEANGLLDEVEAWRRTYYPQTGGVILENILAKRKGK